MTTKTRRLAVPAALYRCIVVGSAHGVGRPWGTVTRRVRWLWAGAVVGLGLAALILAVYTFNAGTGSGPSFPPPSDPTRSVAESQPAPATATAAPKRQGKADPKSPDVFLQPAAEPGQDPFTPSTSADSQASDAGAEWASTSVAAVSAVGGMMSGVAAVATARRNRSSAPVPAESAGSAEFPHQSSPASSDTPAASGLPSRASCQREPYSPRLRQPGRRHRSFDPPGRLN